jgi:hypothetical protein
VYAGSSWPRRHLAELLVVTVEFGIAVEAGAELLSRAVSESLKAGSAKQPRATTEPATRVQGPRISADQPQVSPRPPSARAPQPAPHRATPAPENPRLRP